MRCPSAALLMLLAGWSAGCAWPWAPVVDIEPELGGIRMQEGADEATMLEQLGYVDGMEKAGEVSGVTIHDRERAFAGTNLVVSAHAREVLELDMDGKLLRRWAPPDFKPKQLSFRRAFPTSDGGLIALVEGHSMFRFAPDGSVQWKVDDNNHHDADLRPDGTIVSLTRKAKKDPTINPDLNILEDFITWYDADGRITRQVSVLESLRRSPWWQVLVDSGRRKGDLVHTNSVEVLDGRAAAKNPAFREGNILISLLYISLVAVIDPEAGVVVWAFQGEFHRQHDAELLPNGNLSIFDNHGAAGPSAVRVYNLTNNRQVWSFKGSPAIPLHTENCGGVELLPNGNRLIVESNKGRVIEITRDKEVVWEWRSPYRTQDDDTLVANLYDVLRLPPR